MLDESWIVKTQNFLSLSLQKLTLVHVNSNQCLDKASEDDSQVPSVRDCSGSRSQQWLLRNVTLPEIFWAHKACTWGRTERRTDGRTHSSHQLWWRKKKRRASEGGRKKAGQSLYTILSLLDGVVLRQSQNNRHTLVHESPRHSTLLTPTTRWRESRKRRDCILCRET